MADRIVLWVRLLGTLTIVVPAVALACAVCFVGPEEKISDGYYTSVLFLMAMPYTLVGTISGWLFLRYRAAQGRPVWAAIQRWLRSPWVQLQISARAVQHLR